MGSRVIQLTDIHLVPRQQRVSKVLDTYTLFEQAIEKIADDLPRLGHVDAIVVTGDVSDNGDEESYRDFHSIISRLNLPYVVIPGNHDKREAMVSAIDGLSACGETGELNSVYALEAFDIIALDTVIPGSGAGALSDNTLAFLESALATHSEKPALIALHHPPFDSGIQFMDNIGLKGRDEMARILTQSPREKRVICGHLHNSIVCNMGNATVLSAPGVASSFMTDYRDDAPVGFTQDPGGYMVHDWHHGFRSTYISLSRHGGLFAF
ncbi:phosphodiesterase [Enterovibrio norvegicus]|uniref:Phosphodiesterase n=1 Tax=Enterovibrio norvegicus TaxID=188144 RepID=A0A2N7L7X2_9GAMM|nr:phosphodiesterase [Enterovibrio norvegicus]PMN90220.1 phosphodiesterase [Enterovibrio norvegicus]